MKAILVIVIFTLSLLSVAAETSPARGWIVKNDCKIIINGTSNVNNFTCKVDRYSHADNLIILEKSGRNYLFSQNRIVFDSRQFDCGLPLMTKDFQQVLRAKENPEITISFISLSRLPCDSCVEDFIDGVVSITIAGVSKETVVNFSVKPKLDGTKILVGNHEFNFCDFGLEAPSKFMGIIQVENQLSVMFSLELQELALK